MTTAHVILGIIGISVLIFVHELGHFLAAKWAGVRVKTFSLGFDPTIRGFRLKLLSWTWGDTEYVIGLIPFGGYVRMLGDTPEEHKGRVDEFAQQPAYRRAVIFAAGATVNILFGIAAFILAFAIGVSFQAPEVGSVLPGSAAWDAGITPGDTVLAIDGVAVESMPDVALTAVLGGCIERTLTLDRAGTQREIKVAPRIDKELGMPALGLLPTVARTVASVNAKSAAGKAGIAPDDEILAATLHADAYTVRLDAAMLPSGPFVQALRMLAQYHTGKKMTLRVKSARGAERDVVLITESDEEQKFPLLGVKLAYDTVRFVRPGSDAAVFFRPGDAIATINGSRCMLVTPIDLLRVYGTEERLAVRLEDGREATFPRDALLQWIWRQDVIFGDAATRVLSVHAGSRAARAALAPGDRIVRLNDTWVGHRNSVLDIVERLGDAPVKLAIVRGGRTHETVLPAGGALGIVWDERPEVGGIESGSAVEGSGIQRGDRVIRVGEKKIASWDDFVAAVQAGRGRTIEVTVLRDNAEIAIRAKPIDTAFGALGLGFHEARVLIREPNTANAVALGVKRTVISIEQIFVTLLRLVKGEVATRNLQGPLGIIHVTGYVTRYGFGTLLYFLALISVNLGVLNLLPIPIFDGGHLMLLACEKIKGSPVNESLVNVLTTVVFFLLIALAVYVTCYDVIRIIG